MVSHPRSPRGHAGFTFIEMVVVVAISGVLMAMLLPAVQGAREAARRLECVTRLKQIALALQSYQTGQGMMPMGSASATFSGSDSGHWSVHAQILGELEHPVLYNAINFQWGVSDSPADPASTINSTAIDSRIDAFLCPSDTGRLSRTNYRACLGSSVLEDLREGDGMFTAGSAYRMGDAADGASNTILFGESVGGPDSDAFVAGVGLLDVKSLAPEVRTPGARLNPASVRAGLKACDDAFKARTGKADAGRGRIWARGTTGHTLFNTVSTPGLNAHPWGSCGGPDIDRALFSGASSAHPGGTNILFVDGTVRFVKDGIDESLWWALGSRSGRETIPNDAF